jgi:prolyl-tRNA synthetase
MLASKMLITTLKEAPNEAVIDSHILLLRAGMIRKLVAGVYNYMPLGLRTLHKIEAIIREEMDNAGGLEILSSALQPKELWEESGRWFKYGPELMRLKDRHDREFCLGPTHEEIFTDLIRNVVKSSKNLPINVYQIQTKYRDELRPRFGLMRGREFIMKDAYSFDKDVMGLDQSYQIMYETYSKIFSRFNLRYKAVLADTGAIGGTGSHQFMALSEVGESNILYCDHCSYAADEEKAAAVCTLTDDSQMLEIEEVYTPKQHTIEEVSTFLGVEASSTVKCVLYKDNQNNQLVAAFVRGDREVNEIKLVNALGIAEAFLGFASDDDIKSLNTYYGFIGPVGLNCKVIVDKEVAIMKNIICGANKPNYHLKNVNFGRDFTGEVIDLRKAVSGDLCPVCGKPMNIERGIEVGQIFKLGTKYSDAMNCTYTDEKGANVPMVMGCYGIGVTRTMSSIIEQHHDEFGIKWPLNVAPYHVVVVPVKYADEAQKALADKIYEELKKARVEVILDDRNAGFGFKAKDWELIGIPYQIVVGREAANGIVEFKVRETNEKTSISSEEAISNVLEAVCNL